MVNFWQGKKVFITGHTGFKGSWLSLWLHKLGASITGYSLAPPTPTNLFTEAKVSELITDISANICDLSNFQQALVDSQAEVVFHLAAQPIVRYSYAQPIETYLTNVMGTINLFESIRLSRSVRAVVNVTSDKCYANNKNEMDLSYKETDAMGGDDPYSSSKGCAELVTTAYRQSFFRNNSQIGIASARGGNVIGGGDWAKDRLIPDIISAYKENKSLEIRYPNAIRPWQHVLECLVGYIKLAQHLYADPVKYAEAWNFGPNKDSSQSVSAIIQTFTQLWGKDLQVNIVEPEKPEANCLRLDSTKARNLLNWSPILDLNETLSLTVTWYNQFFKKENMQRICFDQIGEYMNWMKI